MLLQFRLPQTIILYGIEGQSLDLSAKFIHKRYTTYVRLPGGETTEPKETDNVKYIYRRTHPIEIVLEDTPRIPSLADLLVVTAHPDLLKLLEGLALKVLHAIRNIGRCPEIPETLTEKGEVQDRLKRLNVEYSEDGVTWVPLIPTNTMASLLSFGFGSALPFLQGQDFTDNAWLNVRLWPHIVEMLEDDKEIPPEDEFRTNALGHLQKSNYRLAVLESIICLEIVLSQFLRTELEVSKKLQRDRIDTFLNDLGLKARLSVILDYALHESYIKDIVLVLKVVGWRNKITHGTGRLPPEIPEEALIAGVNAVLELAKGLAERRDGIRAGNEMDSIGEKLQSNYKEIVWLVSIRSLPWHEVKVEVIFNPPPAPNFTNPSRDVMSTIIDSAADLLEKRDKRFQREKHLSIAFRDFSRKEIWSYYHGITPP